MHSVSIIHTFHPDCYTIMLMTLLTYSEEVQQMWKYLEWMLRASASSHPESPRWAPCQFNHTASWHPAGKPCHILILTMVVGWSVKGRQEKFHKSHKGGKNVAFGAILANWGNFLSSIKIPRPWQVMQGILRRKPKVHCFHFQIESKDYKRRFMLLHLGVLCWLLYFTGGDGIHELPIQMELFTDRSLTLFSHLRIVAAVDLHMLSQKIVRC